jgi:hypothetical protein
MNQRRIILALVTVGLVSAAIWTWHERLQQVNATFPHAEASAPAQDAPLSPSDHGATTDAPPAVPSPPQSQPVSSDSDRSTASANVEPPSVDEPEPAERKFASGGHAQPDQN